MKMEIILNDIKIVDRLQDGGYTNILKILEAKTKLVTKDTQSLLYLGYLRKEKKFIFLIYFPNPDKKGNSMKIYIDELYINLTNYFFLQSRQEPKNKEYYDDITSFLIDMKKRIPSIVYG